MGEGEESPLGPAGAKPNPEQTTRCDADLALDGLEADALWALPRVEPAIDATSLVAGDQRQGDDRTTADRGPDKQVVELGAGHKQHDERHRSQDHRRAQFWLQDNQGRAEVDDEHHRANGEFRSVHATFTPGQQIGDEDDQRQLGQLRRLDDKRTGAEPSGGAVAVETDPGNEQHHQQNDADDHLRPGEFSDEPIVDAVADDEGHRPDSGPGGLTLELEER